jgi:hypothetical protein
MRSNSDKAQIVEKGCENKISLETVILSLAKPYSNLFTKIDKEQTVQIYLHQCWKCI